MGTVTTNSNDVYYDELISLITGSANISSQYVIFENTLGEYYAINVAKVEELIRNKDIDLIKSSNSDDLTLGVARIRDNLAVLLYFDKWIGTPIEDSSKLSLIIVCKYSSIRLGLIVKNVIGIQNIELDEMFNGTQRDQKIAYAAQVMVNGKKELCNIFDFDQLTMDIYPNILTINETLVDELQIDTKYNTEKIILIAEDSILIQKQIKLLLDKLQYHYQIFDNGASLYNYLQDINLDDIALIITDIEMPVMDGIELLNNLYNHKEYKQIPVLVHTNMSNSTIATHILQVGACDIVEKLDLVMLKQKIEQYIRK